MAQPDTSRRRRFVRDCRRHGMGRWMALFVALQVTMQQKGPLAVLRGEAPDVYALDRVPGVSHTDLYATYLTDIRRQAAAVEVDGEITLQNLVAMKEWIAEQEGVEIIDSSRIETALLFVRGGGDLESGKVRSGDVFRLLGGEAPEVDAVVTAVRLRRARHGELGSVRRGLHQD